MPDCSYRDTEMGSDARKQEEQRLIRRRQRLQERMQAKEENNGGGCLRECINNAIKRAHLRTSHITAICPPVNL